MCSLIIKIFLIFSFFIIQFSEFSIDINLAEYQYLADHLSEKECNELVAALHFHSFELPKDINAAERRIPEGMPCLDLLLHWNSAAKEGRGETHTEVCHRLNQIGREDLAQWLSKTVFHEISKDLKVELTAPKLELKTLKPPNTSEGITNEEITDEAPWWKIDSLLEILIVFGLVTLMVGSLFLCILCVSKTGQSHDYQKLEAQEF